MSNMYKTSLMSGSKRPKSSNSNREDEAEKCSQDVFDTFTGGNVHEPSVLEVTGLCSPITASSNTGISQQTKQGSKQFRRPKPTAPLRQQWQQLGPLEQALVRQNDERARRNGNPLNRQSALLHRTNERTTGILGNLKPKAHDHRQQRQEQPQQTNSWNRKDTFEKCRAEQTRKEATINLTDDDESETAPGKITTHPYKNGIFSSTISSRHQGSNHHHQQGKVDCTTVVNPKRERATGGRQVVIQDNNGRQNAAPKQWLPELDSKASSEPSCTTTKSSQTDLKKRKTTTTRFCLDDADSDESEDNQHRNHKGNGQEVARPIVQISDTGDDSRKILSTYEISKITPAPKKHKYESFDDALFGRNVPRKSLNKQETVSSVKHSASLASNDIDDDDSGSQKKPFQITKVMNNASNNASSKKRKKLAQIIKPGASLPKKDELGASLKNDESEVNKSPRRSERNTAKKQKKDESVIDLMSEDESEACPPSQGSQNDNHNHDVSNTSGLGSMLLSRVTGNLKSIVSTVKKLATPSKKPPTRTARKYFQVEVLQIAIGTKLFSENCSLFFQDGRLDINVGSKSSREKSNVTKAKILFGKGAPDVTQMCYYIPDNEDRASDEQQSDCKSFLALKVEKTDKNCLKQYYNCYLPDSHRDDRKSFIVIEFESSQHLRDLYKRIGNCADHLRHSQKLTTDQAARLGEALGYKKVEKGKKRKNRIKGKETDAFVNGRKQSETLLVYPFAGDPTAIEAAAAGLHEARGVTPDQPIHDEIDDSTDAEMNGNDKGGLSPASSSEEPSKPTAVRGSNTSEPAKIEQRRHFLTIQVRDFERLCEGEWLNDTLIDFWIQWITRNIDTREGPNSIHCFSSHFFTTLDEEGVESVTKWTAKRGINVFDKKFVFIPINENVHWSLCVVINPGHINEDAEDGPMACLLFLDSLKAHSKKKISKLVRKWLNSEWARIRGDGDAGKETLFTSLEAFPLLTPTIPYQNNSWDCGVFVCRYAFALISLRNHSFNRNQDWYRNDLASSRPVFNFNMSDIARLRKEIMTLIANLSNIFLPWKEEQDRKAKEERRAKKLRGRQMTEADAVARADEAKETVPDGIDESPTHVPNDHGNEDTQNTTISEQADKKVETTEHHEDESVVDLHWEDEIGRTRLAEDKSRVENPCYRGFEHPGAAFKPSPSTSNSCLLGGADADDCDDNEHPVDMTNSNFSMQRDGVVDCYRGAFGHPGAIICHFASPDRVGMQPEAERNRSWPGDNRANDMCQKLNLCDSGESNCGPSACTTIYPSEAAAEQKEGSEKENVGISDSTQTNFSHLSHSNITRSKNLAPSDDGDGVVTI